MTYKIYPEIIFGHKKKPFDIEWLLYNFKKKNYSISETLMVLTIPLSLIGIAARLIK